jgi:hypothetical protein
MPERLNKRSLRSGIEEVEYIARNEVSTMRNLYRSCNERFPIVAQDKIPREGDFAWVTKYVLGARTFGNRSPIEYFMECGARTENPIGVLKL